VIGIPTVILTVDVVVNALPVALVANTLNEVPDISDTRFETLEL
jgi:hypothetical protein